MKHILNTFWHKTRGASIVAIVGLVFVAYSLYLQIHKAYEYTSAIGVQTLYTAGGYHALCQQVSNGVYTSDPVNASTSCAQAASDEAAKGHSLFLGIVLLLIAAYWANRRLHLWPPRVKPALADPDYVHGRPAHKACSDDCHDDKPERDC